MIEVIIRDINEAYQEGVSIGEFPPSEIKPLVDLAKENEYYGLYEDGNDHFSDSKFYSTQFYVEGDEFHFEIILE